MSSAAALLLDRLGRPGDVRLGALHPEIVPRLATGLSVLDVVLGGGIPRGRITELAGPRGAGRTGVAAAIAASATRAGETIAWVDPEDVLDPEAAVAAGIALSRLLWVRPRGVPDALRAAEILLGAGGFGLVLLDLDSVDSGGRTGGGIWPRLARAAERTRSALLVVAPRRAAGTFAALGLELGARRVRWTGGPGRLVLLEGIEASLTVARSRLGRPGQSLVVRQACA